MLALVPPHQGGLLPLSLGLLHPQEIIRECTVDIFNELRQYPVSIPSPFVSFQPNLIHARGTSDWSFIPPVIESLPEIRIREASSGAESQGDERTPIHAAALCRSPLCGKGAFKPKRIKSY